MITCPVCGQHQSKAGEPCAVCTSIGWSWAEPDGCYIRLFDHSQLEVRLADLAGELHDMAEELARENDRYERLHGEDRILDDRERARDMVAELKEW